MSTDELSHLDAAGRVRMVDVSGKASTARHAAARGELIVGATIMRDLAGGDSPKGNVYETARLAGIQAAKQTSTLIPLCHALALTHVEITFEPRDDRIGIRADVKTHGQTGVEMEALTAVAVAGLTLYDMLKAKSHDMVLTRVRLVEKSGGRSGHYTRDESHP